MMFFLALALHALTVRSDWTVLKLGLAGAGLMWTRPDGFIYFGALGLGFLLFDAGRPIGQSRLGLLKIFLWAGALTTVLYLPWLLWAWHYFGSPIPHTIIAKGVEVCLCDAAACTAPCSAFGFPFGMLVGRTSVGATFLPANALLFGGWHWTGGFYSARLWPASAASIGVCLAAAPKAARFPSPSWSAISTCPASPPMPLRLVSPDLHDPGHLCLRSHRPARVGSRRLAEPRQRDELAPLVGPASASWRHQSCRAPCC